jgi:hypothetical protein
MGMTRTWQKSSAGEKGARNRRGEAHVMVQFHEFAIHSLDKHGLPDVVHVPTHQIAQASGQFRNPQFVPAHIGRKQPGNATGCAGRQLVDIAAARHVFMGQGIEPDVETGPVKVFFHSLIATPDLHALHCFGHDRSQMLRSVPADDETNFIGKRCRLLPVLSAPAGHVRRRRTAPKRSAG